MASEIAISDGLYDIYNLHGRRLYKNLLEGQYFYFWRDTKGRVCGFVDKLVIQRERWLTKPAADREEQE